jgi:hypothetical protein
VVRPSSSVTPVVAGGVVAGGVVAGGVVAGDGAVGVADASAVVVEVIPAPIAGPRAADPARTGTAIVPTTTRVTNNPNAARTRLR